MAIHLRLNGHTAPAAMLPEHDWLLYDPATTPERVRAAVAQAAPPDGSPWHLTFWAMNNREAACFVPWEDDARWARLLGNAAALADEARARDCRGVWVDLELYLWTRNRGGGPMRPPAWEDQPRITERAAALAHALSGLPCGGYVATGELPRLKGLRRFLRAFTAAGGRLLCECYTGHCAHPRWTRVLPGKHGGAGVLARRKSDGWAWEQGG